MQADQPVTQHNQTEHPAVARARNHGDYGILAAILLIIGAILFMIVVFMFVFGQFVSDYAAEEGAGAGVQVLTWGFFLIGLMIFMMVLIRMMRQEFLGNCLQIEFSDYAWLRDWANTVSADLRMPHVEIFVTQNPFINAFALGFMRPYNIVLNSGAIRYLTDDEIRVVVLHEMAHIKYGHTKVRVYTGAIAALPFFGPVFDWMLNFFYRRAEYTCDSLAYFYIGNPELIKQALIKVHVGPDVACSFNEIARQWQQHHTNNLFNLFTQTFSTHPFLVRRLSNIDQLHANFYAQMMQYPHPQMGQQYPQP